MRDDAPALLVDYGGVISLDQPRGMLSEMASLAGLEVPEFVERYWRHRPAYDRGIAPRTYWAAVLEAEPSDDGLLDRLVALDLASWSRLNPDTLEVLGAAHERGSSLSLLSNAPHDLADMLSDHPALANFEHLLFSSRLGAVKPGRAVFDASLQAIGRRPDEVVFIDDRPENVQGARRVGLRGVLFTSAEQLRAELLG
jgi:putative hydrolase of the HAD superfamily